MELEVGRTLIQHGVKAVDKQVWADLGAGSGFFTQVLASLLPNDAVIYPVDKDKKVMSVTSDRVVVRPIVADFNLPPDNMELLDGILVANALHYVRDKKALLESWKRFLKPTGHFIVVEYDTSRPNQWVPYPVSFTSMQNLAKRINAHVVLLGTADSAYQAGGMYACELRW
jgi:ubiquinone/menaquinone biosynthesis C-methylase UbiE